MSSMSRRCVTESCRCVVLQQGVCDYYYMISALMPVTLYCSLCRTSGHCGKSRRPTRNRESTDPHARKVPSAQRARFSTVEHSRRQSLFQLAHVTGRGRRMHAVYIYTQKAFRRCTTGTCYAQTLETAPTDHTRRANHLCSRHRCGQNDM